MSDMDFDIPEDVLSSYAQEFGAAGTDATDAAASETTETDTSPDGSSAAASEDAQPTTFTSLDPQSWLAEKIADEAMREALAPYAAELHKGWQGDFTQKTQALSEKAKAFEAWEQLTETYQGLEPQTAAQMIGFVQSLDSGDPEVIRHVLPLLVEQAKEGGYLDELAQQLGLTSGQQGAQDEDLDLEDLDLDDPAVKRMKALEERLSRFEQMEQRQQEAAQRAAAEAAQAQELEQWTQQIEETKNGLKELDKSLDAEDLEDIIALSIRFGGDTQKAYERFKQTSGKQLSSVLESKKTTPAGVQPTAGGSGGGHGAEPAKKPETDAEIEAAFLAMWELNEAAAKG